MKTLRYLFLFLAISMVGGAHAQNDDPLFDQVFNLVQNDRHADAISMLDEILKKNPKNPKAYFMKGNSLIHLGNIKAAIDQMEKAVEVQSDYFKAYELLGDLYAQIRNAKKAVENYQKAFETDSNVENKLKYKIDIVNILTLVKQQQSILPHIEDAKKLFPDNFDIQFLEAQYFNYIGDYPKAKSILDPLIKEVPIREGNEKYFYEIGYAYHHLEEYEQAKAYFKNADGGEFRAKLRFFTAEFYLEAADTYFAVYDYDKAEERLQVALAIDPSLTAAYDLKTKLAAIRSPKGEMIKAAQSAISVTEKDGNVSPEKLFELAVLQYQSEEFDGAKLTCDKILQIDNRDMQTYYLRAACEYQLEESGQGQDYLRRAIKNPSLRPEIKAKLYFMLAQINKSTGNLQEAEEFFKSAAIGPFKDTATLEIEEVWKMYQKSNQG